jgi:hypothetical protein
MGPLNSSRHSRAWGIDHSNEANKRKSRLQAGAGAHLEMRAVQPLASQSEHAQCPARHGLIHTQESRPRIGIQRLVRNPGRVTCRSIKDHAWRSFHRYEVAAISSAVHRNHPLRGSIERNFMNFGEEISLLVYIPSQGAAESRAVSVGSPTPSARFAELRCSTASLQRTLIRTAWANKPSPFRESGLPSSSIRRPSER